MKQELDDLRYIFNKVIEDLRCAFNRIIVEFRRHISTLINIWLEYGAIHEKVNEHKDNYKMFRHRYRKTNILNSQVYNRKRICRCRSTI